MGRPNRKCLVCGKEYEFCRSCFEFVNHPVWRNLFDEDNCRKVFDAVSNYKQNAITKMVAKERLSECDLSRKDEWNDSIRNDVNEIMREETIVVRKKKPAILKDEAVQNTETVDMCD